jgi:hypothetical protein
MVLPARELRDRDRAANDLTQTCRSVDLLIDSRLVPLGHAVRHQLLLHPVRQLVAVTREEGVEIRFGGVGRALVGVDQEVSETDDRLLVGVNIHLLQMAGDGLDACAVQFGWDCLLCVLIPVSEAARGEDESERTNLWSAKACSGLKRGQASHLIGQRLPCFCH